MNADFYHIFTLIILLIQLFPEKYVSKNIQLTGMLIVGIWSLILMLTFK